MTKKKLGKGLSALLEINDIENNIEEGIVKYIDINQIEPDPNQPRKNFSEDSIKELANSIKKVGILNPLIVKKEKEKYVIVSGERRFRASKIAGLNEIPVIIKEKIDKKTSFEISIIENIHREDLNPIEEAESFKKLIEEFNYTHQQIGELIGKDRTYITNSLRLLKLSDYVKDCISKGMVSPGHCKVLVNLPEDEQNNICRLIIEKNLSVREVEKLVKKIKQNDQKRENIVKVLFLDEFKDYFNSLAKKLNTNVDIEVGKREKGKLIIHFKNKDELKKILDYINQRS